jgi:hypothetical protein
MKLSPVEWDDLISMVCRSVVARYDSELQRCNWENGDGDQITYFPLDEDCLRKITSALWVDYTAIEARDAALLRLLKEGAKHWPHGWCQEVLDEEEDALASLRDQEKEEGALRCLDCGHVLDEDEAVAHRGECFACYCAHQA